MNESRKIKIERVAALRHPNIIIVLEDIHDPHNAAAILRTCDAMGIQNAWFVFEKEKPYNPKKIGKASSASANKWLDFRVFSSTNECIKKLNKEKFAVVATALSDKSELLGKHVFNEDKLALLVGNEHRGLSEAALQRADRIVQIPMRGFVQSLNVSVATALLLWEITKNRNTDSDSKRMKAMMNALMGKAVG